MEFQFYDYIYMASIGVLIAIIIFMNCSYGKYEKEPNASIIKRDALERRKIWLRASIVWLSIHYYLVLSAFLTTTIVIYVSVYADVNKTKSIFFYSVVSLFTSIVTYVINPLKVSAAYRDAYRVIDGAINEGMQSGTSDLALHDALMEGESVIRGGHNG